MTTNKKGVRLIAEICRKRGIRKVVFSPGSRSAPLVVAFKALTDVECLVIPDERVAGYFAMGMAQQLNEPVAVVCTSGTAVLNLAPAVCEAFYQNIPLLLLTADRPDGAVNNGENQAIMQDNIFGPHVVSHYSVDGDATTDRELDLVYRQISQAITETTHSYVGPVHVNIHMSEPLYDTVTDRLPLMLDEEKINPPVKEFISLKDLQRIKNDFGFYRRKMIIVGMRNFSEEFNQKLTRLNQRDDVVVVYENLSNLDIENGIWNIDACLATMSDRKLQHYMPELVITMGGQIVSKRIKKFLKGMPQLHWDIPPGCSSGRGWAMFGKMFDAIEPVNEMQFLNTIIETYEHTDTDFKQMWLQLSQHADALSRQYIDGLEYCDFKVFDTLNKRLTGNTGVQYGNSTPIRYANFFKPGNVLSVNANRGTSGIDGSLSTAAGAAYATRIPTVCVLGDVSFLYDSNGLWNNYLSPKLRIIVINNNGGNIFRLIEGPNTVNGFEEFFETRHQLTAKHLATMYGLPYYFCAAQSELEETLDTFLNTRKGGQAAILEIKTNGELSAAAFRNYFEYLSQNKQ
jgi:2-succinyl-5-enolpyruvyl-6-hydroxy-3-cyclohexene-1-carboxylate synthase